MTLQTVLLLLLIGLLAGTLSGLVGLGGGIVIVPALVFLLSFSQHQAQGTSLGVLLLPVGILAVINYYQKGYVDLRVVALISIAFIAGGWLGSRIALALPQETIRRIFALVLIYTACRMLGWDQALLRWIRALFS
ncbi:MAG TPA: sulfite exporter TauE/SafE family protein [Chitinophagaceae bacterium]|nr:sulfite exporter TauE/SafE family protein [Chitinophagaceae bacterium]